MNSHTATRQHHSRFKLHYLLYWMALIAVAILLFARAVPVAFGAASVTVAGTFQSELGCPGDWQPECESTFLTDVGNDVWRGQFAVPAGSHEYKMALDGAWDEAYPAENMMMEVSAETTTIFYFDDKSKGVLDTINNAQIPVVAGNIQAAVGCPGDWQPECLQTLLTDADGDGVYTFVTSALNAGDYEFKIAFNEGWNNGEIPDSNAMCTVPFDNAEITFTWDTSNDGVSCSAPGGTGGSVDISVIAPRVDLNIQEDIFYFVLTDRYENGDPSNDEGANAGGTLAETGYDATDISFYHGGDIAGLQSRLSYLSDLGVSAIWMTPPYKNIVTQPDSSAGPGFAGSYHGYWILDFENADPHLGTTQELKDFVSAAHAEDIKVFFDFVVNHTADVIQYAEGESGYRDKANYPYQDADGNTFDDADFAGGDTFPALDAASSFPYTPEIPAGMENAKNPAWLNDPIYYHNRGSSSFSGENSLYGDFFGLDDTFTEHPDVVNGYIDIATNLIETFDIDGFRIDTVKHVNLEFWQSFGPEVMTYAQDNGKPDFYMFGEVFEFNQEFNSTFTTEGNLPSLVDFGLWGTAVNFSAQNGATDNLRNFFEADDYFIDADSNAYGLGNFVSNHDGGLERLGGRIINESGASTDAERVSRSTLGHGLIYFSRGFPIVYYGDEQGFVGLGSDKLAREDMMPSQVAEFNDNDLIGTDDTTADSNFDQSHPIYQTLAAYAGVRNAHAALAHGAQIHRYSESGTGIYAFSRIDRDERVEYVVALNNDTSDDMVTFEVGSAETTFTQIYPTTPARDTISSNSSGELTVMVPALDVVIYQADSPMACGDAAPNVSINVPLVLDGRVEIAASLTEDIFAEVTFAVSTDGGANYEIIGTDDNAPYRVFYDVSEYEANTELTFQAVVNDLCGNEATGAAGQGTVGEAAEPPSDLPKYAIVHYYRPDGDYGDHTTGDYNDFWGLHLWGDPFDIAANPVNGTDLSWTNPMPFLGEDDYGRFAYIALDPSADPASEIGFIVHRGDTKDGSEDDRFFQPFATPEIFLRADDGNAYTSKAEARGSIVFHYNRPDGDYDGWGLHLWQDGWSTAWTEPFEATSSDDYGAVYEITDATLDALIGSDVTIDFTQPLNFIMHKGDEKDPDGDRFVDISGKNADFWLVSGSLDFLTQEGGATNKAYLHYHRDDGDYGDYTSDDYNEFWGLHVWNDTTDSPGWTTPLKPVAQDSFGVVFEVNLTEGAQEIGYIIHRGDEKDPGPDQFMNFGEVGYEIWQLSGADPECPYVYPIPDGSVPPPNISKARAHWVTADTIVWPDATENLDYTIHWLYEGGLEVTADGVSNGDSADLTPDGTYIPASNDGKFPHLAGLPVLKLDQATADMAKTILKGQIAVLGSNGDGAALVGSGIQIPGVLDDLYADAAKSVEFGAVIDDKGVPTLSLWAPTAQAVTLHIFDSSTDRSATLVSMTESADSGVWSQTLSIADVGKYYLFEVQVFVPSVGSVVSNMVTDPYSHSLSMNSTRSQIVTLDSMQLKPTGWDTIQKPPLTQPEDISIYEMHVRDFSIFDETVPEAKRGTFAAFTEVGSDGMQHLQALADAGLSHLHLLPVFDIATINEDADARLEPDYALLSTYGPTSTLQQEAINAIRDDDGFNWGYDPYHFTVPEGSYSTNPDGSARIVEFREMVQTVNGMGLRLVMDVVYNHTSDAGQSDKSVFDRIVPGYYHRLDEDGNIATSTCCQNTASEHEMFEKFMIDSILTWAIEYKVDSFRFDLMGHHMKSNMLNIRAALDSLTIAEHGVDGSKIYLYGEGWNFGEVANNARGVNATQANMAGTGIGTFSDRLRDAVRGPGPFDGGTDLRRQGFINGQYYDPNIHPDSTSLDRLLLQADQIRVGMTGNLASYEFEDRFGNMVTGAQVDYNGSPTGYTEDPQEVISYISKHDNQTLFDINAYTMPEGTTMAERVRAQGVGYSIVSLGQGIPFYHGGMDVLRSKSLDRNSYNSGDWFNRIDWTYQTNNWGVGLPLSGDNGDNWPIMTPLLADPTINPSSTDIALSNAMFREFLEIRNSSPLFRLGSAGEIKDRVYFQNTGPDQDPGFIVMTLFDTIAFDDIDPNYEVIYVLINATDEEQKYGIITLLGRDYRLHPVQQNSADSVVKTSTFSPSRAEFTVPARTTAVFVRMDEPSSVDMAELSVEPVNWMPVLSIVILLVAIATVGAVSLKQRDW